MSNERISPIVFQTRYLNAVRNRTSDDLDTLCHTYGVLDGLDTELYELMREISARLHHHGYYARTNSDGVSLLYPIVVPPNGWSTERFPGWWSGVWKAPRFTIELDIVYTWSSMGFGVRGGSSWATIYIGGVEFTISWSKRDA